MIICQKLAAINPGYVIAHYRITAKLGQGGMGEVWRATDTRLNREVAVKILPDTFAQDADRLTRFTREAQLLASLNHPNIATIYGVEERALIIELVEGPTLAERIARGPIPLEEALPIATQIAEALEYAHERGVVHRDLKPANIKITPKGRVKVLDFGLAKALSNEPAISDPATSPTLTMRATLAGVILGTAAYMSPEQARGQDVDRRADIWSFGAVLHEMLSGHTLFGGPTISDTPATCLEDRSFPPFFPAQLPPDRRALSAQGPAPALAVDPGDVRLALEEGLSLAEPPQPQPAPHSALPWAIAGVLALALAITGAFFWRATRLPDRPLMRLHLDLGPDSVMGNYTTVVISPRWHAHRLPRLRSADGVAQLATRLLNQSKPILLPGTRKCR